MARGAQIKITKLPTPDPSDGAMAAGLAQKTIGQTTDIGTETPFDEDSDQEIEAEPERPAKPKLPPVPSPSHFTFKINAPKGQQPDDFFSYWIELAGNYGDRLAGYVYRNWPVIQIRVPSKKSPTGFRVSYQIDKVLGNQPIKSLEDLIHRYGCGDYTVRLNDQVGARGTIALCIIKGQRDMQDHPPVVQPGTLSLDDPANGTYIEYLRLKGVEIPGLERIEDMRPDTSASDRLAETVERMADQNIRLAGEAVKAAGKQEKPPEQARSSDSDTLLTSMKIVQQATDMGTRIVEQAVSKAGEITGKAGDPSQMLKSLGDLLAVVRVQPGGGDNSAAAAIIQQQMARTAELETRLFQVQTQHLQSVEAMLREAQAKQAQPNLQPAGAAAPITPAQYLTEMAGLKEKMEEVFGSNEGGGREPWWAKVLPIGFQALSALAGAIVAYSHNAAVARTGQGRPVGPGDIQQVQPAAEEATATIQTPPGTPAEGQPQPELPKEKKAMAAIHGFLERLREPLLKSLDNDETGDSFAEKLVAWYGQMAYDYLHDMGPDAMIAVLSSYPPIWNVVSRIPQKFEKFFREFMAYGDQGGEEPVQPPPQGASGAEEAPQTAPVEGQGEPASEGKRRHKVKVN